MRCVDLMARFIGTALTSLFFMASAGVADPYRLGVGDEISVALSSVSTPISLTIDADGEVRLAPIGGVRVATLSMDDAEVEIERLMEQDGLFVNPVASLSIINYAPVIVGGDVINPGRFSYVPGMTVATALALSGGSQARGLTPTEIARAQADAQAGMLTSNLEIALAVARLARFQAMLAGPDAALALSAEQRRRIPSADSADIAQIVETEINVLKSERTRSRQLLLFWENEIKTIEAQRENFDARIAVQREIVESTVASLSAAQELAERGLQTGSRLATAEQRAADARSRVLELEAAKMAAARAISTANRERVVFLANQERDALVGVQQMNKDLETAAYRYQRFQDQDFALSGGVVAFDATQLTYTIQSLRPDRPTDVDISLDTVIFPGETLIVSVTLMDELES